LRSGGPEDSEGVKNENLADLRARRVG
jgi:hypothetical protein